MNILQSLTPQLDIYALRIANLKGIDDYLTSTTVTHITLMRDKLKGNIQLSH